MFVASGEISKDSETTLIEELKEKVLKLVHLFAPVFKLTLFKLS